MLAASSPINYPQTSSPPLRKRRFPSPSRGIPDGGLKPKPRTRTGFLMDEDSDDDQDEAETIAGPTPKRILVEDASQDKPESQSLADPEEETRYQTLFERRPQAIESDAEDDDMVRLDLEKTTATFNLETCSGKLLPIRERKSTNRATYESMVASRSRHKEGRAKRSFYGIEIHSLIDAARAQEKELETQTSNSTAAVRPDRPLPSVEANGVKANNCKRPKKSQLWTEKYRARSFMDLVGDDLTNRQVLRWLKGWDPLVFPHAAKSKAAAKASRRGPGQTQQQPSEEERLHRKILMLTGPPGLGKTTLAHVCARQAGYEVLEINASDDRSRDVVRGRIRTSLGTESVKTVEHHKPTDDGKPPKVARPVCVVVDEVDGVVSGSGGSGEGGFVKALIDLVLTDQKNSAPGSGNGNRRKKKKGDDFRQMRPLILICNDVYHVSLRPLRQSGLAEIVHVGKPTIDAVVTRLKTIFDKEGIPCEKDAARKLCEYAWGMTSGIDARRGAESTVEGDLRGVMVVGEWVAGRVKALAAQAGESPRLTRQWIEQNVAAELAHGGGGARGLGRGSAKDVVARVFQEGAGFPKQQPAVDKGNKHVRREQPRAQLGFGEQDKKHAMERLNEMVAASGEVDRIMVEIFAEWPGREFGDDCYLTKPNTAYEWMNFHDSCSSRLFSSQEWELAPYLSQPVLACHHLFASPRRHIAASAGYDRKWGADPEDDKAAAPMPFSGPRADYEAREAEKHNRAMLQTIQAQLSPTLGRAFRSPEHVATDFLPYLVRLVSPNVKPVVVGGSGGGEKGIGSIASVRCESEKLMVKRAAEVLAEVGIELVRGKIEEANPTSFSRTQWVYRMEPDLDALATFETMGAYVLAMQAPTRYAVRQVLDQELQKALAMRQNAARQARFQAGRGTGGDSEGLFTFDKETKSTEAETAAAALATGPSVKRDFFGRVIVETPQSLRGTDGKPRASSKVVAEGSDPEQMIWVTYNEGLNNAVRKPISLEEFLRGL